LSPDAFYGMKMHQTAFVDPVGELKVLPRPIAEFNGTRRQEGAIRK